MIYSEFVIFENFIFRRVFFWIIPASEISNLAILYLAQALLPFPLVINIYHLFIQLYQYFMIIHLSQKQKSLFLYPTLYPTYFSVFFKLVCYFKLRKCRQIPPDVVLVIPSLKNYSTSFLS